MYSVKCMEKVAEFLKALFKNDSGDTFEACKAHMEQCVAANGDYSWEEEEDVVDTAISLMQYFLNILFNSQTSYHCSYIALVNDIWSDVEYGTVS